VGWPELYDEMCAVAGRGLFRGYDADDLAGLGIGFSLFDMPALAVLSGQIVAEEKGLRRPIAVMMPAADVAAPESRVEAAPAQPSSMPTPRSSDDDRDEQTFDVPVRLALVSSRA
jgi:hypothetical protein